MISGRGYHLIKDDLESLFHWDWDLFMRWLSVWVASDI